MEGRKRGGSFSVITLCTTASLSQHQCVTGLKVNVHTVKHMIQMRQVASCLTTATCSCWNKPRVTGPGVSVPHHRELTSVWTDNSRITGADGYTHGAGAEQEPPLSRSATGQAPARPARLSAAPPALPFALQPCSYRWISGEPDGPEQRNTSPPPHNVVNVGTETTLLHAESFFRILQRVEGEPEVLTASVRAACLCRCSCWHARNERGFNWFRKPQGRF